MITVEQIKNGGWEYKGDKQENNTTIHTFKKGNFNLDFWVQTLVGEVEPFEKFQVYPLHLVSDDDSLDWYVPDAENIERLQEIQRVLNI